MRVRTPQVDPATAHQRQGWERVRTLPPLFFDE